MLENQRYLDRDFTDTRHEDINKPFMRSTDFHDKNLGYDRDNRDILNKGRLNDDRFDIDRRNFGFDIDKRDFLDRDFRDRNDRRFLDREFISPEFKRRDQDLLRERRFHGYPDIDKRWKMKGFDPDRDLYDRDLTRGFDRSGNIDRFRDFDRFGDLDKSNKFRGFDDYGDVKKFKGKFDKDLTMKEGRGGLDWEQDKFMDKNDVIGELDVDKPIGFKKDKYLKKKLRHAWSPIVDLSENEKEWHVHVELPGVNKKDVTVTCSNGKLIITGVKSHLMDDKETVWHKVESDCGKFVRIIDLPINVESKDIKANMIAGILEVVIPKPPHWNAPQTQGKVEVL